MNGGAPEIHLTAEQGVELVNRLVASREAVEGSRLIDYRELSQHLGLSPRRVRQMKNQSVIFPMLEDGNTVRFHLPSVFQQLQSSGATRRRKLSL